MPLYAFFRLVSRPAFVLILPISGLFLVMALLMALNLDLEKQRALDLSMLALPLVIGLLVGQTANDVRYRFFSWTLPKLHSRLGASVIGIGLGSALLWSLAYRSLGGELGSLAAFAGFLLIFMVSAAVQRAIVSVLAALLAATIWADLFFGFIRAQPLGWTVFALLGVAFCFHAGFSHPSSRRILLSPHFLRVVNAFNAVEVARAEEEKLKRSARPKPWRLAFVGTEIVNWVRAIEYGSRGAKSGPRAFVTAYAYFALMGFLITSTAFLDAYQEGASFEVGLERAFHVLFEPPVPLEDGTYSPSAFFQAAWAWSFVFAASSLLRRGWVYPLSRRLRSLIVFRMSLRTNLRLAQMLSLTFVLYGGLIVLLRKGVDSLGFMPGFFRGVIALVILLPLVQWIHLWLDRFSHQDGAKQWSVLLGLIPLLPFAGLVQLLTVSWPRLFAEVSPLIQGALLLALVLVSQGLYYRVLKGHFERRDLT